MTLEEIAACVRLVERHGVPEFRLERDGATLVLRGVVVGEGAAPALVAGSGEVGVIRAGALGVFRRAHPAEGVAPVAEGEAVRAGAVVGFLQVGACLRAVVAGEAGVLGEALVEEGALVGFGDAVFGLRA